MRNTVLSAVASVLLLASSLVADGPADNQMETVRSVPPPGIAISEEQRGKLTASRSCFNPRAATEDGRTLFAGRGDLPACCRDRFERRWFL